MRQTKAYCQTAPLSEITLPGPDTTTKEQATRTADPRLQLMLREAAHRGWPIGFEDDLYLQDRQYLAENPGKQMLWILRENGTQLYCTEADSRAGAGYIQEVIHYYSGEHKLHTADPNQVIAHYYLVTDDVLKPITWRQAQAAISYRESPTNSEAL